MKLILVCLLLTHLFWFSSQVPAIRCGAVSVLEEEFDLEVIENCDDKFVCELKCSAFKDFKNCKHDSFLDLTELLKKDINYKLAYNNACKNGLLTGEYLNDPVSLKFREFIELVTHVNQETYFQTETRKYIPFTNKYPGLYKESIEKIRELPEFKNTKDRTPMNAMIKFEDMYMEFAIKGKPQHIQDTVHGLYFFYKGLMGVKNNCEKKFKAMKDKSRTNVATMITEAINKQIAESVAESKASQHRIRDGFAGFHAYYNKVHADVKNREMFQHNSNVLYTVYATRLTDALLAGSFTTGRKFCGCDRFGGLQSLMDAGINKADFSIGFTLKPFLDFLQSTCQEKCDPPKVEPVKKKPEVKKVEPVKPEVKKDEPISQKKPQSEKVKPISQTKQKVKKVEPLKKVKPVKELKPRAKKVKITPPARKNKPQVKKQIKKPKEDFKKEVKELKEYLRKNNKHWDQDEDEDSYED
jgi:hypothetical protein